MIRKLKITDKAAFLSLLCNQFEAQRKDKAISSFQKEMKRRVSRCFIEMFIKKRVCVFVARNRSEVIQGYVVLHWLYEFWAETPEGLVSNLYVRPSFRKQGIGSRLIAAVVEEATKRHVCRLWLENHHKNPIYKTGFYKKQGWIERQDIATFEKSILSL